MTTDDRILANQYITFLDTPLQTLQYVGAKRALLFRKLGVERVYDLISFFPRKYEDWTQVKSIADLENNREESFVATILKKPTLQRKGPRTILRTIASDGTNSIQVTFFNQPYMQNKLVVGEEYFFHGKVSLEGYTIRITNPVVSADIDAISNGIRPIYPSTKGLPQGIIRGAISFVMEKALQELVDPLPVALRNEYHLCAMNYAYEKIHQPTTMDEVEEARKRLCVEELFLIAGGLAILKRQTESEQTAPQVTLDEEGLERLRSFVKSLPFEFTDDQKKAFSDISVDIQRKKPMNRLVEGDVGSGKTIVALLTMVAGAISKTQSIYMAPTSILATQHYDNFVKLLDGTGIRVALLQGSTPAKEKKIIRAGLLDGTIDILVGTHAVLSSDNHFHNLGIMVTDEQHRFGVRQRKQMEQDSEHAIHTLVMSATPIPRTLALILYGDLDISIIRSKPNGRKPIHTMIVSSEDEGRIIATIRSHIEAQHQVYIVCPLVDESETEDEAGTKANQEKLGLDSVVSLYDRYANVIFTDQKVALLHGKMKSAEKDVILRDFLEKKIDVLIATTVVEVGVDNPNATLMVIRNSERFGLSTLHQLRGRIGRGSSDSLCLLHTDAQESISRQRLEVMTQTTDGFEIAKQDLILRGPGEFFGTRQHGLPAFHVANLYQDAKWLPIISDSITKVFSEDPMMQKPENKAMIEAFRRRFGDAWEKPTL